MEWQAAVPDVRRTSTTSGDRGGNEGVKGASRTVGDVNRVKRPPPTARRAATWRHGDIWRAGTLPCVDSLRASAPTPLLDSAPRTRSIAIISAYKTSAAGRASRQ